MAYLIDILELFGIFSILAISLNYLIGNAGVFFLGHIAFFAIGGYATAILSPYFKTNPFMGIACGMAISMIMAMLLGKITLRLSGHYLLIVSLGFCEIVRSIANNSDFSGGAAGIVIRSSFFSQDVFLVRYQLLLMIGGVLALQILFFHRLSRAPKGRLFVGVRDDGLLLTVLGKDPARLKLQAFVIASGWASLAGSLFALYAGYIDPTSFTVQQSLLLFIAILVGGLSDIKGSLLAAFILIVVPVIIRFINLPATIISPVHQITFAVFVILVLKYKPDGFFGKISIK